MTNTLQSLLRRSAALALVGFAASAMAVPITYNFQGAMAGGQTVQGQFSYDLALMTTPYRFNSSTFSKFDGVQPAGQPAPLTLSGTFSSGGSFSMGAGTAYNDGGADISTDICYTALCSLGYGTHYAEYRVYGRSVDVDGTASLFQLYVLDDISDGIGIFPTAGAGLDLAQPINWLASGATAYGMIGLGGMGYPGGSTSFGANSTLVNFTLTSISRSQVPEPSTYTLMLAAGLGLMLTSAMRRRKTLAASR